MTWQTGLVLICLAIILLWPAAVLWARWRNRFTRKLMPDALATRKRRIAEHGYRASYDRRWTL
jgi:hypothetical protein